MGWEFAPAMLTAMAVTAVGFFGFIYIAARFGINLTP
jgi:predicted RND superfamily exporter protein